MGKTDITCLTMSGSGKSSGVIGIACSGRLIVQDGRSTTVVFAAPTDLYKRRVKLNLAVLEI